MPKSLRAWSSSSNTGAGAGGGTVGAVGVGVLVLLLTGACKFTLKNGNFLGVFDCSNSTFLGLLFFFFFFFFALFGSADSCDVSLAFSPSSVLQ